MVFYLLVFGSKWEWLFSYSYSSFSSLIHVVVVVVVVSIRFLSFSFLARLLSAAKPKTWRHTLDSNTFLFEMSSSSSSCWSVRLTWLGFDEILKVMMTIY